MTKIRKQFDPKWLRAKGTDNKEESQTQPDMNLSVRQIMKNHTRGIGLGVMEKQGIYSETDVPYFDDITEMHDYMEHLKEQEKTLKAEIKAQIDKQKKEKEEEVKAKKVEQTPPEPPKKEQ